MTATFNPGQAEVAYVAEVQYRPAVAPTVTLTMSLDDAHLVRALLGNTTSNAGDVAYEQLDRLLYEHDRAGLISFMGSAIPFIDPGKAMSLHY